MIMREYREGDFPELEQLWRETGVFRPERGDTSDTIIQCIRQGGTLLVLEDEVQKRIVGSSWLTWDGRRVHMQYFAVRPSRQGNGYGRQLAQASIDFARSLEAPIKLEVHHNNIQAIQLYENMGFKVLHGYEVYIHFTE
jgi:ribosomal protein S18 acetylase RimI-like enzyme